MSCAHEPRAGVASPGRAGGTLQNYGCFEKKIASHAPLAKSLSSRYGRNLTINQVIDASVVGGLKVQIGDDVIDGSIATRLKDLRLQLAG